VTVGENAAYIAEGAVSSGLKKENVYSFKTVEEANTILKDIVSGEDVILVKGSRGMKMEKAVEFIYEL
jgi:UDP-N-acetylmuramoyl-tripeptide--D-alanyl-D-alanine ligase